ncbi:SusC/RagA family TonB-linked outer membrane protein [Flavisolibacter ginsenosidimutans]|uniref:TonB-dependent receptor n=1 Tax=Flavisolibacter ginsenosidimutans TaxID=661481 RepID=A0A5B8UJT3_9BACT|nr:TonB-dependent receptor [Flavisolibacter ginsenosidimutans]QEC56300.1 TonB-dependent receptor [Flavisolibacter ginsenosidimutans]
MNTSFQILYFNADVMNHLPQKIKLALAGKFVVLLTALLFVSNCLFAQQITVRGKVQEAGTLTPLVGATVSVNGKAGGTITGPGGAFSIKASVGDQLSVEHIGYTKATVPVNNSGQITITLEVSVQTLDDVVVVGYGTQKKKDLTGAIASVKLENSPLANLPNVNLLDALKGSVPGLDIGTVNAAGSNPSINIRGQNSISASNSPLIILDGVVFLGSFNEINPADIATVDVLKDASASAIYGSLAANGVVLITTKRGKTEKPTISLAANAGTQAPTNRPDMLTPDGYIQLRKDRFLADNPNSVYDINTNLPLYELEAYKKGLTVDWTKEITRTAPFKNFTLSVAGATNRFNYYVSGEYMDQKGIAVGDQFRRYTFLAKMESRITDWLRTGLNVGFTYKNADGISADYNLATIASPYGFKYVHDRGTAALGFENFPDQFERYPQGQTTTSNPLWNTQQYNEDRNQNYRSIAFARIDAPWVKGLSYTFNYSINRWEGHSANFQHENMFVNTMLLSELSSPTSHLVDANGNKSNPTRTDWYLNHLVNFKRLVGDHSFDVTLLEEEQSRSTTNLVITAKDFSGSGSSVLGSNALELGNPANYSVNTDAGKLNQMASLARLNYAYKGKYLASFSIRQDGYSGYAEGHKYGVFRAGAVAWSIGEEPYIRRNYKYIDNLKLRLSYGENGNPSIGAYQTFPTINANNTILLGGTTQRVVFLNNLANKNLNWEKTTALNLGLDFGIFKNFLSGTINVYNSNTTDLLLTRAIPIMNGFTTVLDNIGKVNNKGVELQLNLQAVRSREFTWSTGFNFWLNRNKIVSLYGLDANKDGKEDDDVANSRFIGKSLGAVYTYVMDGIIQKDDAAFIAVYGGKPGDIKFRDLNNDGKIDANDRTIVGYSKPNFTMTLSNTLAYKGVELYFLFNFIAGGGKDNWYLGNNTYAYYPNALYGGTAATWLNKPYWTPNNPSNTVTSVNYNNSAYGYSFPNGRQFVRLQDVALSYTIPSSILSRAHISAMKVYVSGKNLATFTNWEGLDPETATTFAGSGSGLPTFRIITFGLNASF